MAIKINLQETDSRLFCCSKWWGDPDMPADMAYPMIQGDDSEDYPLTFICQIDCADLAEICPDSKLPKEGISLQPLTSTWTLTFLTTTVSDAGEKMQSR